MTAAATDAPTNGPTSARRPKLIHVTTTDMSLDWLLGPQLEAFQAAGYEVIGTSAPGPHVDAIEARGVRHVPLAHATRSMAPGEDLRALQELRRLFIAEKPDIVHTHNPKPGLYGRLAARAAGVPVVINTVHGLYALPEDPLPKRAVVYGLERLAATCSDHELLQNVEDLAVLERLGVPSSRLTVLGNGIDLTHFDGTPSPEASAIRNRIRAELGIGPGDVVIGAVGRLVREKGYAEVLAAFEELAASRPGVRLLVVGPADPSKPDAISDAEIRRAESSGVIFAGQRTDMADVYRALDVYVLASHREGFPRSAMEASAMGLPVVATEIRGCRQVVDHGRTGLLVPLGDHDRLTVGLSLLVDDADRRAVMGRRGRERAVAEFDQQRVIDLTLATYERYLSTSRR